MPPIPCMDDSSLPTLLPNIAARSGAARVRLLLTEGADPNERDKNGRTALFRTARVGKVDSVLLLMEFGADPNLTDHKDEAPLQVAARYGHLGCVETLLSTGADVNHCPNPEKTDYSETALCSAARKGFENIVSMLLAAGADPNLASNARLLPLVSAAGSASAKICELLINAGANVNQAGAFGETALHRAVRRGAIEIVKLLLSKGADVNAQDEVNGYTPLMNTIVWEGDPNAVNMERILFLLLSALPNFTLRDHIGRTVLDRAINCGQEVLAESLRLAGAKLAPKIKDGHFADDSNEDEEIDGVAFVSWQAPVTSEDRSLAKRVAAKKEPALQKNYGWEASPNHWRILDGMSRGASKPIPLTRVAYFARGWGNKPDGQELEDAPTVLGESYQAAVDRFVSLGLIHALTPCELIENFATTTELKNVAKKYGVRPPARRGEMLIALAGLTTPDDFPVTLRRGPHYVITKDGETVFKNRGSSDRNFAHRLRKLIIEALLEPNLEWALLVGQELNSLRGRPRIISEKNICMARLALNGSIPRYYSYKRDEEQLLTAIAAACHISGHAAKWDGWPPVQIPKDEAGEQVELSQFAFDILHDSEEGDEIE